MTAFPTAAEIFGLNSCKPDIGDGLFYELEDQVFVFISSF